jgi:hypothetical protein
MVKGTRLNNKAAVNPLYPYDVYETEHRSDGIPPISYIFVLNINCFLSILQMARICPPVGDLRNPG